MNHFQYQNGILHAEDVALPAIAAAVGTPFYCYSAATLTRHYQVFAAAFDGLDIEICYALKANSNQAVIKTFADLGAGADVVSGGELERALRAGIPPGKIVFAGVGKTPAEMRRALELGIAQFNVESEPELEALSEVASSMGAIAPVALRINPDIDAVTHAKITTGKSENKFGIPITRARDVAARAAALPGLRLVGVDVHIGSQLTDIGPFEAAFRVVRDLVMELRAAGHMIDRVDLGGGLGVPYRLDQAAPPAPADYGAMIKRVLGNLGARIVLEPGRLLVANAGILVASVIYVKEGASKNFLIIDGAMNDLIRPTLYEAHHDIWPVHEVEGGTALHGDIVGPVCETGDYLAKDRSLPALKPGEMVAIMTAGAYGAVMSSEYNSRPLIPEVMVSGGKFAIVRARPTLDEMIGRDQLPPWLA